MLRTCTAVTFLASLAVGAPVWAHQSDPCVSELTLAAGLTFNPTSIAQTRMSERNGWTLQWHKNVNGETELLAVQSASLIVRRIDPGTGKLIGETKYLAGDRASGPTVIQSAKNGELIVARVQSAGVEIFNESGSASRLAPSKENIKFLEVVSLGDGSITVVAGSASQIQIFNGTAAKLNLAATLRTDAGLKEMFAFPGKDNSVEIAFFSVDHKVHLFNYDPELDSLEEKASTVQLGGKVKARMVDGRVIFMATENSREGSSLRVFSLGDRPMSRTISLPPLTGEVQIEDGAATLVVPLLADGRMVLRRIEIATGKALGEDLPVGDGRMLADLSQFKIGNRSFFIFNKDGAQAYIQSENEVSLIQAPEGSTIRQVTPPVQLAGGTPVIGVLGNNRNGSVINVVRLTGAAATKRPAVAPTATAE